MSEVVTPAMFRQGLKALGWTQSSFARDLGVNPRTVRKWALGEVPLPPWALAYMRLKVQVVRRNRPVDDSVAKPHVPGVR